MNQLFRQMEQPIKEWKFIYITMIQLWRQQEKRLLLLVFILQIVSILNAAGAEAVSINDQRYTAFTEIERAGNHIEINGVSNSSPIIIKSIGNPDTLESALAIKRGIVWTLRSYDYIVHLTQDKNISIPRYRKVKDFIYAVPVEEKAN